jgi:hypothetical protein
MVTASLDFAVVLQFLDLVAVLDLEGAGMDYCLSQISDFTLSRKCSLVDCPKTNRE